MPRYDACTMHSQWFEDGEHFSFALKGSWVHLVCINARCIELLNQ